MAFKVLSGPYLNSVGRSATGPVMDPVALTGYPATRLSDNRSSIPAFFSTNQNDSTLSVDLNLIRGGSAETSGDETEFTVLGTGALTREAGSAQNGSYGLQLAPVSTTAFAYQDIVCRAGESLHLQGSVKGSAAKILLRNRQTGKYLLTTGAWADPSAWDGDITSAPANSDLAASTGSWDSVDLSFVVESLAICKRDTVHLRLILFTSGGSADFDDLYLWPQTNWCSIHGHNISPFISPLLQSSSDGASWTTRDTMTLRPDSFYAALTSMHDYRHWRILLDHFPDNGSLTYIGEWVLGQSYDVAHNPLYGGSLVLNERQTRLEGTGGDQWVYLHGERPQRGLIMSFAFNDDTAYVQFRDEIFRGSRGGSNLAIIAPIEMDPAQVILGRIQEMATIVKSDNARRSAELEIVESPLPNVPDMIHAYDEPIVESGTLDIEFTFQCDFGLLEVLTAVVTGGSGSYTYAWELYTNGDHTTGDYVNSGTGQLPTIDYTMDPAFGSICNGELYVTVTDTVTTNTVSVGEVANCACS
jgi:hypothetical protein